MAIVSMVKCSKIIKNNLQSSNVLDNIIIWAKSSVATLINLISKYVCPTNIISLSDENPYVQFELKSF